MAFGFTPKFEQDLDLNDLDTKHYLAIALITVKQLDWRINYISKSGFIAFIGGGAFTSMEKFKVSMHDGQVFIVSNTATNGMFDWGKNKKHVETFIETFENIQSTLTEEQLNEKLDELKPVFESVEEDQLALPPPDFKQNLKGFFSFFIPRDNYFITPIIIDINFLVFILMVISGVSWFEPTIPQLIHWGANVRGITLEGQSWRLITNIFLHIGILHILLNMYALLYIGLILEPYLGKARFAAAYLFTGIIASLTSIYWHTETVSAGASGAIFGMYGVFLAMLTTNFIDKSLRKQLLTSIGIFVVYNLMNGLKGGIDNAAHIGGLLSGLAIGYCYYPSLKQPAQKTIIITISALFIATLFTSFAIYNHIPNDTIKYDNYIKEFTANEETALQVFKMPATATKYEITAALNEKGIHNWNKNLKILDSMDKLDLPVVYTVRVKHLRDYCKIRIKSYNYISFDINTNSEQYKGAIDSCNTQMSAIIDSLKNGN
jgi:rhomboid protease GluP